MDGSLLAAIVAPMTPEAFIASHWPRHRLVQPGPARRFDAVPAVRDLADVTAALRIYPNLVMVVGGPALEETEGISDRFLTTPARAAVAYRAGATLELDCFDLHAPALRAAIEAMQAELGLPRGAFAKAIVYASTRGGGFKPHFDAYANFILHLRGEKEWLIAPNPRCVDPLEHYDIDEPFMSPGLAAAWTGEVPREMPADAERVVLRPGTLLFLPRGTWHTTAASTQESMSLNITFSQPTWLDLVLGEVRRRLARLPAWRGLADGCGAADPARRQAAARQLAGLLEHLPRDLGQLDGEAVFARHVDDHEIFQIANLVFRQLFRP